jgi:hypothetical protein
MSYRRRIRNETVRYQDKYEKELECLLIDSSDDNMKFVKFINNIPIKINILFTKDYPFKSPSVTINGYNYTDLLSIHTPWKIDMLPGGNCLCCSTLLCRNNWYPTANVVIIVKEVISNLILKIRFNEICHIKKIKYKYLIDDIPLEEYL